jgi:hypothetical protein
VKYEVEWINNYYATGTIVVEATTKDHAQQIVTDRAGYSLVPAPFTLHHTEITVLGEIE